MLFSDIRLFPVLTAAVLLAGCNQQPTQQQAPTAPPPLAKPLLATASTEPTIALADTAFPYTALEHGPAPTPNQALIDGVAYRIEATAVPDSARPLRYTYPPTSKAQPIDSTDTRTSRGTEVVYTFRVLKPNGQLLFARQLLKSGFSAKIDQGLAVEATPAPPRILGYLPKFNALAFELPLNPPDSDSGGDLLLLLDARTGRVRQQLLSRWNSGCNSPVALSENGCALLTSFDIIQANGHVTNLEKPGYTIAGALLVNDKTVLINYMPDKRTATPPTASSQRNTRLFDLNGRQLGAYTLESTDGGLGYQMQATYIGQTRTYYLFDETNNQLGLLPRDQPTAMRVIRTNQLTPFRAPQRATEVSFSINTESGTQGNFYVDTVSQQVRCKLFKPTY